MTTHTIEIPDKVYSLNRLLRMHWAQQKKIQRTYRNRLAVVARMVPRAEGHRRVCIIRLLGKGAKRYDHDNLVGGAKPLLDALVKEGLLIDDKEEHVTATYAQEKHKQEGIRIEISEG